MSEDLSKDLKAKCWGDLTWQPINILKKPLLRVVPSFVALPNCHKLLMTWLGYTQCLHNVMHTFSCRCFYVCNLWQTKTQIKTFCVRVPTSQIILTVLRMSRKTPFMCAEWWDFAHHCCNHMHHSTLHCKNKILLKHKNCLKLQVHRIWILLSGGGS